MSKIVSAETKINTLESLIHQLSSNTILRDRVRATLKEYFIKLEGANPVNFYALFLSEIEIPLLETVLQYTKNNQSAAAEILKLGRGTLRKKMQQYGLLKLRKNK